MIYVIFARGTNHIKIGWSENPQKRLGELQVGNSNPLELICTFDWPRSAELMLHRVWAKHRITGEWFAFDEHDPYCPLGWWIQGLSDGMYNAVRPEMKEKEGRCG